MNKYKILIFDLDDTLIDNLKNVKHAFKLMLKSKDKEYNEENFIKWYKIDKQFWQDWQDGKIILPEHLKNETGQKSEEFLDWLRAQRVLIYFNSKITLNEAIRLNNIYMNALTEKVIAIDGAYETFVNEILSADMFGYMKPNKEFFEGIEKSLNNYNIEEYLIIGDSLKSDIGFAMKCNFDSCWFNKNNDKINDEYKPTMTINKLRELIEIL